MVGTYICIQNEDSHFISHVQQRHGLAAGLRALGRASIITECLRLLEFGSDLFSVAICFKVIFSLILKNVI